MRLEKSCPHLDRLTRVGTTVLVLTALTLVGAVLLQSGAGFEFSDEGFYLNWIAQPFDYRWSLSHFGYVYRPLYLLVGGNVAALRATNLLILLACSWLFHLRLLHQVWPEPKNRSSLVGLAFAFAPLVWLYLDTWLPTPNYNTLALTALLLAGFAALGLHQRSSATWVDVTLLGVSGVIAFLAKPTCGAALAGLVLIHALVKGNVRWVPMAASSGVAGATLLITTIVIDGSPTAFVHRIQLGLADLRMMQGGYEANALLRLDLPPLNDSLLAIFAVAGICAWSGVRTPFGQPRPRQLFLDGVFFAILATSAVLTALRLELRGWQTPAMIAAAVPFAVLVALVFWRSNQHWNRTQFASAILVLLLPLVYVTGTNNNQWWTASKAGIFWVSGAIALLAAFRPVSVRSLLRLAAISQVICLLVIVHSAKHPYRQTAPIYAMKERVSLGAGRGDLRLSLEGAQYIRELQRIASNAGFVAGQPILDLTGHHPGAVFALGGRSVGRAWMIGSYPGRDVLARAVLQRIDREQISRSWILTEDTGPQQISPTVLEVHGLTLEHDFVRVGTLFSPIGTYSTRFNQALYAPKPCTGLH
ncbi:MAG TPA: hypothetical protein VFT72_05740 [Opitutaceae bacterium]|nr:hypothetical protein [Opitutaceae bacterium]